MHLIFPPFNPTFHPLAPPFFDTMKKKIKINEIMIDVSGKLVYSLPAFPPLLGVALERDRFCSSVVERILGKDEVAGSSPARSFDAHARISS